MAHRPEGHGIRPHSLEVPTISALMTEVVKGNANLSQIAIHGKYRDVTAQDMAISHPRNAAQQHLFVCNFAQSAFLGNMAPRDSARAHPVFLETADGDMRDDIFSSHCKGHMAAECAVKHLNVRGSLIFGIGVKKS